jgi:regulation of enolase protein 1 (concanavalin A-like superfamily)
MKHPARLVLLLLALGLLTSGMRAEQTRPTIKGWGEAEDPDGDCQIRGQDASLAITVPGSLHDLWPKEGKVNAPRVLQDVEGDFTVQVTVTGSVKPENGFFRAATLLIWQDAGTFVRLDRAAADRGASGIDFYTYFHVFKNGDRPVAEQLRPLKDAATVLRLERRGTAVTASFSQDEGKTWRSFDRKTADLSSRVKVGVAVLTTTKSPFTATFENLRITR